ncbi:lysoplasmalogenase [Leptospira ognonensis]|uniref:Lysoplasmalogenase n=1 Tax=Leptospira ognonensis TaxID=2484945 RepID=A0A4R9KAF5_9LEPT|nr:lysoplasmalogenase [Leptospira ognonensis]TGL61763.1 lysoplasmalogenase [Leptospira ognonensis]
MTKDIVLFGLYSIVHLVAIVSITKENVFFLPSKIIPILLLILFLSRDWAYLLKKGKLVVVALVFSLFGDSFLALPSPDFFVPGLGSFLVAQLIYAYAFSIGSKLSIVRLIPFVIFGCTFFYFLKPELGPLLIPVAVYVSAICLMGWRSLARVAPSRVYFLGLFGSLIFILSDSIIAYSMFLNRTMDRQVASLLIMITYYLAQFFIYAATKVEELNSVRRKST